MSDSKDADARACAQVIIDIRRELISTFATSVSWKDLALEAKIYRMVTNCLFSASRVLAPADNPPAESAGN